MYPLSLIHILSTLNVVTKWEECIRAKCYICILVKPCSLLLCCKYVRLYLEELLPLALCKHCLLYTSLINHLIYCFHRKLISFCICHAKPVSTLPIKLSLIHI